MEKRYILRSLPLRLIAGGCSAEPEAACLVPIVWMNGGNCHNLHRRCSGIHRFRLPESDWKSRRRCWLFLDGFGIIDGGAYKGLWGGFVSYEAADYNVFLFFLRMMYLPDCIYSTGSFWNRMRKQWDNGWAVIVISIGNRCFVKEDSYEKVTPVCRVISAKTLRMGVCFISNVTRGSSCSVPLPQYKCAWGKGAEEKKI